jgi:hypothetical protein
MGKKCALTSGRQARGALAFLVDPAGLERVAQASRAIAPAAVAALAQHRSEERLRNRRTAAVAKNGHLNVRPHFEERFSGEGGMTSKPGR